MRRLIALALSGLIVLCGTLAAHAQSCAPVVRDATTIARWTDPHPTDGDFKLPLPGAMSLVFTVVPLGSGQVWGNERSTYVMGSSQLRVFETPLKVRVGSSIFDSSRQSVLMIGKYELSKAQYATIVGRGRLEDGIILLEQRSGDPRTREILSRYVSADSPCHRVLTREIVDLLAEPVTFLRYSDFVDVIDLVNELCITAPNCRRLLTELGSNPDFPGFVRLPSEIEWEFVARGGGAYIQGEFPTNVLQADLPPIPAGSTIEDYAHINNSPARLTPIGSRKELFGFYDLLGNADELMQNPFTSENGFGAVGAYVARGGHYRLPLEEIRVSKRVELTVFRRDEQTNEFFPQAFPYTGLRLMIGLPVAGATGRTGSDELAQWFAEGWEPVEVAGDIAGSTIAEANALGRLTQNGLRAADEVDGNDDADMFAIDLLEFAKVNISVGDLNGPVKIQILDDSSNIFGEAQFSASGANPALTTAALIPKRYYLLVTPLPGRTEEVKYAFDISRVVEPDTGIERPETAALNSAARVAARQTELTGYVGEGDRVDTYPISIGDNLGGLKLSLANYSGDVSIRYLNERQQVLGESTGVGGQSFDLLVPVAQASKGFVQVVAGDRTSTLYSLKMGTERLYDAAFLTQTRATAPVATSGKTYSGHLSVATPRLLLPINLPTASRLRVELSGLSGNVDLDILDKEGQRITSNHQRTGTQPEFFERDMPGGRYFLQITLDRSEAQSPFNLRFDLSKSQQGAAQTTDPATLRRTAQSLGTLSDFGSTVNGSSRGEAKYYSVTTPAGESVMVLDLLVSSAAADLDLFLEDVNGTVLAKSANLGSAAETIRFTTNGGTYYIRVVSVGGGNNIYYTLQASRMAAPRDPTTGWDGFLHNNQDWKVYKEGDTCKMYGIAQSVTPAIGWRSTLPYFTVSVTRGQETVGISMDYSSQPGGTDFYSSTPKVFVENSSGRRTQIAGVWSDDNWFKPLSSCSTGMCVDNDSIRGFRQGTDLIIVGTTADGKPSEIRYSLRGYTQSAKDINNICGGRANWVWSSG